MALFILSVTPVLLSQLCSIGTKFTNYLIEENKSVFQPGGSRTHSPHWDYIENIMRNALKVDDQGPSVLITYP